MLLVMCICLLLFRSLRADDVWLPAWQVAGHSNAAGPLPQAALGAARACVQMAWSPGPELSSKEGTSQVAG